MSGPEEQGTEKQALLEDLRQRYEEQEDFKVKNAAARRRKQRTLLLL